MERFGAWEEQGPPVGMALLGYVHGRRGRVREAVAMLDALGAMAERRYVPSAFPAMIHVGLENHADALDLFERALEERSKIVRLFKVEPFFDRVRGEPRFQALLTRARLAD